MSRSAFVKDTLGYCFMLTSVS